MLLAALNPGLPLPGVACKDQFACGTEVLLSFQREGLPFNSPLVCARLCIRTEERAIKLEAFSVCHDDQLSRGHLVEPRADVLPARNVIAVQSRPVTVALEFEYPGSQ